MLGVLGAYIRKVFINATKPDGEKKVTFDEVYRGPKRMDHGARFAHDLQNNVIGLVIVMVILLIVFKSF